MTTIILNLSFPYRVWLKCVSDFGAKDLKVCQQINSKMNIGKHFSEAQFCVCTFTSVLLLTYAGHVENNVPGIHLDSLLPQET